jgi:hypothetical protein
MKIKYFVLLLILASCSASQVEPDPEKIKTETTSRFDISVDSNNPNVSSEKNTELLDKGVLILPKNYSKTSIPVKLVIYCHSGGGYVDDWFSEAEESNHCKFMSSLGYAVLDMNGIPIELASKLKIDKGRTVGNFVPLRSYIKGYQYVIKNFNIDDKGCYVFANSNGGLTCMNLVNLTNIPILAQAGVCPVVSIEKNLWNYSGGTIENSGGEFKAFQNRANIIRLFGMSEITTQEDLNIAKFDKSKVGKYDPFEYLINGLTTDYRVPFKIFQPKDDWAVSYKITKQLADEMQKRGGNIVLREFETGGHSPEPQQGVVGSFVYKNIQQPLTPTVLESALWFQDHGGYNAQYAK